jgi:voltage-gated potassium channel
MKMALIHRAAAAVLLLTLTLCLQWVGVAALIEWLSGGKNTHIFGPPHAAVVVVKSTIAIVVLHGLVILLWASFYRLQCFPSWELAFCFSAGTYATSAYGDVILSDRWRLLGPLEGIAGVLMCGVPVCLLYATMTRLIDGDPCFSRTRGHVCFPSPTTPEGKSSDLCEQTYA